MPSLLTSQARCVFYTIFSELPRGVKIQLPIAVAALIVLRTLATPPSLCLFPTPLLMFPAPAKLTTCTQVLLLSQDLLLGGPKLRLTARNRLISLCKSVTILSVTSSQLGFCPSPPHLTIQSCSLPQIRNKLGRSLVYAIKKAIPTSKRKTNTEVKLDTHPGSKEHDRNLWLK